MFFEMTIGDDEYMVEVDLVDHFLLLHHQRIQTKMMILVVEVDSLLFESWGITIWIGYIISIGGDDNSTILNRGEEVDCQRLL